MRLTDLLGNICVYSCFIYSSVLCIDTQDYKSETVFTQLLGWHARYQGNFYIRCTVCTYCEYMVRL